MPRSSRSESVRSSRAAESRTRHAEHRLRDQAGQSAERRVSQIGDIALRAGQRHGQVVGIAVRQPVLHCGDRGDGQGLVQLGDGYVRQPNSRDLAFLPQLAEGTDAFGQRHLRVDVVQLIQVDPVYLESPQADLTVGAEGAWPAVDREAVAPAPVASLRRDQRAFCRQAAQGACYHLLGVGLDARARVGERRVDEPSISRPAISIWRLLGSAGRHNQIHS